MKKILIIAIIAVVFFAGAYFLFSPFSKRPATIYEQNQETSETSTGTQDVQNQNLEQNMEEIVSNELENAVEEISEEEITNSLLEQMS